MKNPDPRENELSRQVDRAIKRLEARGFFTDGEAMMRRRFQYGRRFTQGQPERPSGSQTSRG